jgi:hypothetical protein
MAFGDVYGYRTNATDVVAFAEGDEYAATVNGEAVTAVDLVLTGFASGTARRKRVPVVAVANAETNQAWKPGP